MAQQYPFPDEIQNRFDSGRYQLQEPELLDLLDLDCLNESFGIYHIYLDTAATPPEQRILLSYLSRRPESKSFLLQHAVRYDDNIVSRGQCVSCRRRCICVWL